MNHDRPAKSASGQGVQVIARAAEILRVLKQDNRGLSLGQISDRVGLPRSTVQRIVNALLAEKLIMNTAAEGGLRLGPEIQSLAAAGRVDAAELLRPVLQEIAESCGETVDLAVFRTDHMVFVDQVVGTHRVRTVSAVGETFPLISTANGKAALALLDDEMAIALAVRELKASHSEKPLSALIAELEEIRTTGLAWDCNEHTEGLSAVGFGFRDSAGLIYALSVPVPSYRFAKSRKRIAELLKTTAPRISALIS
uniref:IclR family transcriptional regulator n=1 Tax=Pararhizobium sp. IMCC3301 TaxID=3067904 RepID=UPI0027416CB2|nr:IclR family transcriptional regulator [Pararhizobium sp. IMCC3301]